MATVSELTSKNIASAQANVQTWGNIIVNVKVYGAKGDGVTDDTSAISSAITTASSNGGTVFFPKGDYLITSTITIDKPLIIEGEHYYTTRLMAGANLAPMIQISSSNVILRNIKFSGESTATAGIYIGSSTISVAKIFIEKCYINTFKFYGIIAQNCYALNIRDSWFYTNGSVSLRLQNVTNPVNEVEIRNNVFESTATAIQLGVSNPSYQVRNVRIVNNVIQSNNFIGINIYRSHNVEIIGNWFENNGINSGYDILSANEGFENLKIADNLFVSNQGNAASNLSPTGLSKNLTFVNNKLENNTGSDVTIGANVESVKYLFNRTTKSVSISASMNQDFEIADITSGTTLGSVTRKIEVFDKDGTSLGFIPVYDTIT